MEAQRPPPDTTAPPYEQWPSVPSQSPGKMIRGHEKDAMDTDNPVPSPEQNAQVFSMDDLEVAKALTASPAQSGVAHASRTHDPQSFQPSQSRNPEPLLSLLTSQHPIVATAINQSLSAYTTSKTYSPRFRQGAEFVERNIASPVASTVGTAGRISGVETGVRWWLQRSDSSGEAHEGHERQRLVNEMDVEQGVGNGVVHRSRAGSELSHPEYLPAYDENRSPVYEEYAVTPSQQDPQPENAPALQNWHTRLMMSTSGLGVAMSDESLRSLKYCLSWLRWANTHLNHVLASLQNVLLEWDRSQSQSSPSETDHPMSPVSPSTAAFPTSSNGNGPMPPPRDEAVITSHLAALKAECVKTLKSALEVVSTYAGGALPDNARALVRRHLTSLPLRFRIASGSNPSSASPPRTGSSSDSTGAGSAGMDTEAQVRTPDIVSGARRVVVLAREGLDMMSQVSGVVDGTIVSAEEWCDRLGRRKEHGTGNGNANANGTLTEKDVDRRDRADGGGDVHMGGDEKRG